MDTKTCQKCAHQPPISFFVSKIGDKAVARCSLCRDKQGAARQRKRTPFAELDLNTLGRQAHKSTPDPLSQLSFPHTPRKRRPNLTLPASPSPTTRLRRQAEKRSCSGLSRLCEKENGYTYEQENHEQDDPFISIDQFREPAENPEEEVAITNIRTIDMTGAGDTLNPQNAPVTQSNPLRQARREETSAASPAQTIPPRRGEDQDVHAPGLLDRLHQDGHVLGVLDRIHEDGRVGHQPSSPGILLLTRLSSLIGYRPANRIATVVGIAKLSGGEKSALATTPTLGPAVTTVS